MIKENSLTREDLDAIWRAQQGKHEAIVKNLHDLLAKLAWDFTPDQLDHLFDCFKVKKNYYITNKYLYTAYKSKSCKTTIFLRYVCDSTTGLE